MTEQSSEMSKLKAAPLSIRSGHEPGERIAPARIPRWYVLTWFLGVPPPLTTRQWRVLALISLVSLFEQYDVFLFQLNLRRIQAELGISDAGLGWLGSMVSAGALLSIGVTRYADRIGRRRMLMFTVLAYTLLTGLTAFAPDARSFVALQFLARVFAVAESLLAIVVVAEEFDASNRGWGIGALGGIMACGGGLAALLFGFVDSLPYGWRSLYVVGLGPLLCVAWLRRTLPETGRFEALSRTPAIGAPVSSPGEVLALIRAYPRRVCALAAAVFVFAAARFPAGFFAATYLQAVHGWTPRQVSKMIILGGMLGIIGNAAAGRLSDRFGRRPVTLAFLFALSGLTIALYRTSGLALVPVWIGMVFAFMGSNVMLSAFGAELFPTTLRSTASGARAAIEAAGNVVGLSLVAILYPIVGSNWNAIVILAGFSFIAPLVVWALFPETAGRELEEIAPEQGRTPEVGHEAASLSRSSTRDGRSASAGVNG